MGKLLIFASCCIILTASQPYQDLETNLLSFQDEPRPGHVEAFQDKYVKLLFANLLGRRLQQSYAQLTKDSELLASESANNAVPDVMHLHKQLQNKLGWGSGSDDGGDSNKNQHGPPAGGSSNQYGPPPPPVGNPNINYGPPPNNGKNLNQYGPPQNNGNSNQYGPPPINGNPNYGPPPHHAPPPQKNQYGPPQNNFIQHSPPIGNQNSNQYGPPAGFPQPVQAFSNQPKGAPQEAYGGPPPPPPSHQIQNNPGGNYHIGNDIRVNQGHFGGHKDNFAGRGPQSQIQPQFNAGINNGLENGKIFKHVYIHTPPPDQDLPQQTRVIRPTHKQDTHYQIIFVKAPSPPQMPPTEVEIPQPPSTKTLVYVLVKKPEKPAEIKFRAPPPTKPASPEVYFIRYKGNVQPNQHGAQELLAGIGSQSGQRDEGYSAPDSALQVLDDTKTADYSSGVINNNGKTRESAGYPNTEYRAPPNMLNPNQEPMSIAVYDKIRNGIPATSANTLDAVMSSMRGQKGSHYTAPGSLPFDQPSGRMINGEYLGMTSTSKQYYSPADDERGYQ